MDANLRHVTIPDLAAILDELDDFWSEDRDMGFLHQALYVQEFGRTSVLAEHDGRILGYLLGFVGPEDVGYIHAVAVRGEARGAGLARRMYERFEELARGADAYRLKAITGPENSGSRAFHEALGFTVEEVDGYSPSSGSRLVFWKALEHPIAGADREVDLGDGLLMRPVRLEDSDELHRTIEANREHIGRWLPFSEQPHERTAAYVRQAVRNFDAGRGVSMTLREDGRLVGMMSFVEPSREHRLTEIGYWLAEDAQGRGIVSRALAALVEQAFEIWDFERVEIHVAADNERSRAIPERLGFSLEGRYRNGHRAGGSVHEELVYGLLRDDPRPWGR